MNNIIIFPIYFFLFYLLNFFFKKNNFLLDKSNFSTHKKYVSKNEVPITGGILFYSLILFFFQEFDIIDKIFLLLILIIGLLSDTNILRSPFKRIALQIFVIISYVYTQEIFILDTRFDLLDNFLENSIFLKVIFSSFCLITLVNGTNFIDGTNFLAGGYILTAFLGLMFFLINVESSYKDNNLQIIAYFLIVFLIFNIFSLSYLGDGGAYLISIVLGIVCIKFSSIFLNLMSPFFIVLLLWYPALENLFSIIRRGFFENKNVNSADNFHLHHLIFKLIKNQIKKNQIASSLTGIFINIVILIFIFFGIYFANDTKVLIFLIILKTITYFFSYIYLKKTFNKKINE